MMLSEKPLYDPEAINSFLSLYQEAVKSVGVVGASYNLRAQRTYSHIYSGDFLTQSPKQISPLYHLLKTVSDSIVSIGFPTTPAQATQHHSNIYC